MAETRAIAFDCMGGAYLHGLMQKVDLLRYGRPRWVTLFAARSIAQYRQGARLIAERHRAWLRSEWFSAPDRTELRGYCALCRAWRRLLVDHGTSYEWEGRLVPWWTNTLTCPSCALPARLRASLHLFEEYVRPARDAAILLTEQVTPFYRHVARRYSGQVVGCEFLRDGTHRGTSNAAGIRSEDLTALSFDSSRFSHVLSFEVFEHIPDYKAALRECARVLRPGGVLQCTVPFVGWDRNLTRARIGPAGEIQHLLPPEYHGDPLSAEGTLCFRAFGLEFLTDLWEAGFRDAVALLYWSKEHGYLGEDRCHFLATV